MLSVSKVPAPSSTESVTDADEIELSLPAVLGRGSLLRCAETKVSRRHCTLDWDSDGVVIKAVHKNPTFVCIDGVTKELKNGQQSALSDGDSFGMLSQAAWYKVTLKLSKKDKRSLSVECKEDAKIDGEEADKIISDEAFSFKEDIENTDEIKKDDLKPSDAVSVIKKSETLPEKSESVSKTSFLPTTNHSNDIQCAVNQKTSVNGDNSTVKKTQLASTGKVRTLPSWLSKIANEGSEEDSPKQVKEKEKKTVKRSKTTIRKNPSKPKNKPVAAKRKVAALKYDAMSDSSSDEEVNTPNKKSETSPKSETSSSPKKVVKNLHELSESDEDSTPVKTKINFFKGESDNSSASPHKAKENFTRKRRMSMSSSDDDDDAPLVKKPATSVPMTSAPTTSAAENGEGSSTNRAPAAGNTNGSQENPKASKQKRPSCRYGSGCYRKNPQHRKDESHPGDSDYHSNESEDEDDGDDDRPECEFGVDCYRKNPQHRKNFKHTRYPQPQRRAKRKAKAKKNDDGDSEDSYDYDDPFLNDDSSDDFAPTDSEGSDSEWAQSQPLNDEEKEELKRARKEANKFLGKKKRS